MITLDQIRIRLIESIRTSGMTQAEICRRLNIKSSTIAQYLSGRAMPALDTFANLCAILDIDANDILCISEYEKSEKMHISHSFNGSNISGSIQIGGKNNKSGK